MSLQSNRTASEIGGRTPVAGQARKAPPAPVFKPDFARSLRMHPRLATAVAALVFTLLVTYALLQKPMYEAESLVRIEPNQAGLLNDNSSGLFDSGKYDSLLQQQVQTAQRLDVLTAAVHSLPAGTWRESGETEQNAAARLQNALKVQRVLSSFQLSFTLRGSNAQHTADTLNAVVSALLQAGRKDQLSESDQRTQILLEEKARIQADLGAERAEQASLSARLGMADPGFENGNPYDSQLSGLRTELAAARESHDVAAAQLAAVSGPDATRTGGLRAAADDAISGDAGLSSMKATISQRRAVLSGQMAGLTAENPIYKQDSTEIADLDRSLEAATTQMRDRAAHRLQDKLRSDLARTGDVEARMSAQLAAQTYAATSASPRLQRASEVNADIARLMKRYAEVDDALRTLSLNSSGPGTAHLALAATAPLAPVPNRRHLLLLAALPLALICGLFGAVYARKQDTHIYGGRDLEDLLGFTPLAVLPAANDVSSSMMDEYVLRLAGGVESAYRASGAKTFLFTPASPATDLTSLMSALESRLTSLGLSVTTIGAHDMLQATPSPHDRELMPHPGNEGTVATTLVRIKQERDLVFIHAPALLYSAETEYMARCADATVLVAESCVSRRHELLQAAILLERLHVKGIAAVLIGLPMRLADESFRTSVAALKHRQDSMELAPIASFFPQRSPEDEVLQSVPPVEPVSVPFVPEELFEVTPIAQIPESQQDFPGEPVPDIKTEPETVPEQRSSTLPISYVSNPEVHREPDTEHPAFDVQALQPAPSSMEIAATPYEVPLAPETSWLGKLLSTDLDTTASGLLGREEQEHKPDSVLTDLRSDTNKRSLGSESDTLPPAAELQSDTLRSAHEVDAAASRTNDDAAPTEDSSWLEAANTELHQQYRDDGFAAQIHAAEPRPELSLPPVDFGASGNVAEPETTTLARSAGNTAHPEKKAQFLAEAETVEAAPLSIVLPPTTPGTAEASLVVLAPSASPDAELVPFRALRKVLPLVDNAASPQVQNLERPSLTLQNAQASVSGIRVARLDPVLPPRTVGSAWKDRRISKSDASYRSPERRFQWSEAVGGPTPTPSNGDKTVQREPSPLATVAPDHTLTRHWALLSHFGESDKPEETPSGQQQEKSSPSLSRHYRQG